MSYIKGSKWKRIYQDSSENGKGERTAGVCPDGDKILKGGRWKEIWNDRGINWDTLELELAEANEYTLYKELKRLDGFDVQIEDQEAYYKSFYNAAIEVYETELKAAESIYEVGCGSGANLVVYKNRGKRVGGIDYSSGLVGVAEKLIPESDITLGEAVDITAEKMYDAVISDSVFAYFPNVEYGKTVLKKMYDKARYKIIILEVFDKDLENECNAYRRSSMKDYDEKYAGLDKVFYSRKMFIDFALQYGCKIKFTEVKNEQYWNSRYMYNCFLYKEEY